MRFCHEGSRRSFLRLLAGSPAVAASAMAGVLRTPGPGEPALSLPELLESLEENENLISSPKDAINVFEFEPVARQKLPPAHFGYLTTGVDDDATLRANRDGFTRYEIRVRRLIDVSKIDMAVELFGTTWKTPVVLDPAGSQRAFHPEGELAVARAARSKGHLQILSTTTTTSVEDVVEARGEPVWYQLYAASEWNVSRTMVKRAEAAGCPVLVLTVDQLGGTNRETLKLFQREDKRQCSVCHDRSSMQASSQRKPMFAGLDLKGVRFQPTNITWDYVRRLKDATPMKLVIKGIVTREDAELSVMHGADGIICSNHGGRAEASGRSSIESLPEVLEGAAGRIPVLVDGGFRRGTDIFKALALGAKAVCMARPYLWGLAAFGQEGVEAILDILARELELMMRYAGTSSVGKITRAHVIERLR
jgi:4-hydroxymandelate oxidase